MWWKHKRAGGLVATVVSGTSGYNFFSGAVKAVGSFTIGPGEWFGLMVGGLFALGMYGWPLRKWRTKEGRFELLVPEMMEVVEHSQKDRELSSVMSPTTRAKAEALSSKFRKVGIDPPDIFLGEEWHRWLPKMVGCATAKDLDKAKKITAKEKRL